MRRNESTNDRIVRLFNEGWEAEKIADDLNMQVGAVNDILERRVEGYADLLLKKSLEANKARTAAKEEALRREREKEEAIEAKLASYTSVKKPKLVNPDDFFTGDLDGMLVGNYKQKNAEPEKETVNILTAKENRNLLTGDIEENKEETPVVNEEPAPVQTVSVAEGSTASQKMALFAKAQIAENDEKIKSIKALADEVRVKIAASEEQNVAKATQIADIDAQIKALYDEIAVLSEKINELEASKSEVSQAENEDATAYNAELDSLNEQIVALEAENEEYRALIK